MGKEDFHARSYLVDKKFQFKYTLIVTLFSAVVYGVLGYFIYQKELANSAILQIQNPDLQDLVTTQDLTVLYYLMAFFILQIASVVIFGILITHRIAGPLHRTKKYLEDLVDTGELHTLQGIRTHDEFHEFFGSLSKAVTVLKEKQIDRREKLVKLRNRLEKAESSPEQIKYCESICDDILEDWPERKRKN